MVEYTCRVCGLKAHMSASGLMVHYHMDTADMPWDGDLTADCHTPFEDKKGLYSVEALQLSLSRGWDGSSHMDALESKDEDRIAITHQANFLSEDEFERFVAQAEVPNE